MRHAKYADLDATGACLHHGRSRRRRMELSGQAKVDLHIESRHGGKIAFVTIDNATKLNAPEFACHGGFRRTGRERPAAIRICARSSSAPARAPSSAGRYQRNGRPRSGKAARLHHARPRMLRGRATLPGSGDRRVNGHCYGAGMELAAACDMRISPEPRATVCLRSNSEFLPLSKPQCCRSSSDGQDARIAAARRHLSLPKVPAGVSGARRRRWRLDAEVDRALEALVVLRRERAAASEGTDYKVGNAAASAGDRDRHRHVRTRAYESDEPRVMMEQFLKHQLEREG